MEGFGWIKDVVWGGIGIGIMVKFAWGYYKELTKRRKPGDQLLSLNEFEEKCKEYRETNTPDCDGEHEKLEEGIMKDMGHLAKDIKKDLGRGQERFGAIEKKLEGVQKGMNKTAMCMVKIETIVSLIASKDGIEIPKSSG